MRANEDGETHLCRLSDEAETLADLTNRSAKHGAALKPDCERVRVVI